MQSQALFFLNRESLKGKEDISDIQQYLAENGLSTQVAYTGNPAEGADLINRHRGRIDTIILAGGDGTIHKSLSSIVPTGLPLGIIPRGTANDLARTLNIPTDSRAAASVIVTGRVHHIDLGMVNSTYFLNVAHIGLGAQISLQLSKKTKRTWGVLGYPRSLITAYQRNHPLVARLVCNGQMKLLRSIEIAVGNGKHYGGFMTIARGAKIDDHLLNVFSLEPQGMFQLFGFASALRRGDLDRLERTLTVQGRRIDITTRTPTPVVADGEFTTRTPAHFEVVESILPVYVPKDY